MTLAPNQDLLPTKTAVPTHDNPRLGATFADRGEKLRLAVQKPGNIPALIPLGELISYSMQPTPSEIDRQDLTRQVVISGNLEGLPLGTAIEKVGKAASQMKMAPGYKVVFSGEAEHMGEAFGYMVEALILAIILVYLILAAQFESFIDPLSIMLSLPLSLIGMAGMLIITGDTISIMSLIGLIMLMGLVTKNAILLVDYTKVLRNRGVIMELLMGLIFSICSKEFWLIICSFM